MPHITVRVSLLMNGSRTIDTTGCVFMRPMRNYLDHRVAEQEVFYFVNGKSLGIHVSVILESESTFRMDYASAAPLLAEENLLKPNR